MKLSDIAGYTGTALLAVAAVTGLTTVFYYAFMLNWIFGLFVLCGAVGGGLAVLASELYRRGL
jgi:hypothetical protein